MLFPAHRKEKQHPIGFLFSTANHTSAYIARWERRGRWPSPSECPLEAPAGRAPTRLFLSPEHQGTLSSVPHCAGWICLYLCLAAAEGMHSLNREIEAFSRKNLRKQCTRVTTLTGKKIAETWKDARIHAVEEMEPSGGGGCGYVQDLSLDLKVGVIKPWLLLGECIWLAAESLSSFNRITSHFSP